MVVLHGLIRTGLVVHTHSPSSVYHFQPSNVLQCPTPFERPSASLTSSQVRHQPSPASPIFSTSLCLSLFLPDLIKWSNLFNTAWVSDCMSDALFATLPCPAYQAISLVTLYLHCSILPYTSFVLSSRIRLSPSVSCIHVQTPQASGWLAGTSYHLSIIYSCPCIAIEYYELTAPHSSSSLNAQRSIVARVDSHTGVEA